MAGDFRRLVRAGPREEFLYEDLPPENRACHIRDLEGELEVAFKSVQRNRGQREIPEKERTTKKETRYASSNQQRRISLTAYPR